MAIITTVNTNGAGYYLNDNTASGGKKEEDDIFCCSHCQKIVPKTQYLAHGGWCRLCHNVLCGPCYDRTKTHGCEPFRKKVDMQIELTYRQQQRAKLLGT